MSLLVTRKPGPRLSPFISSIWFCERDFVHVEKVLPSGRMQLLISLAAQPVGMHPLTLAGPKTEPSRVDTRAMSRLVGVHFHFGGAAPFLNLPCTEVVGRNLDLQLLWRTKGEKLRDRLGEMSDPWQIMAQLEIYLEGMLGSHVQDLGLVRACAQLTLGRRVADVVTASGLSRGTFVRRVRTSTGLSPKRIVQLSRFQTSIQSLAAGEDDLARLAQNAGYYDQSHCIREFQRFSGQSPGKYSPRSKCEPNHIKQ